MLYSVSEQEYLRSSLVTVPIIRPDSRGVEQFRPLISEINFLPTNYGSARVRTTDGSECVVGVKAKVQPSHKDLIQVSVDILGLREKDLFQMELATILQQALVACPEITRKLKLTPEYAFTLYVDCIVISHTSYPLGLISCAVFQALKATKLPRMLKSEAEKGVVHEIPQFDDDWNESVPLCENWTPPILFIVVIVGSSVIIDPSEAEEQVAEAGICVTWKNSAISGPTRSVYLNNTFAGSFDTEKLFAAYDLVEQCAPGVVSMLQI